MFLRFTQLVYTTRNHHVFQLVCKHVNLLNNEHSKKTNLACMKHLSQFKVLQKLATHCWNCFFWLCSVLYVANSRVKICCHIFYLHSTGKRTKGWHVRQVAATSVKKKFCLFSKFDTVCSYVAILRIMLMEEFKLPSLFLLQKIAARKTDAMKSAKCLRENGRFQMLL